MSNSSSRIGRWIAAGLATVLLVAVFYNVVKDNTPKGDVRKVAGYTPWEEQTLTIAETLPIQNGGRIKPLSSYAGFTMLGLHGARSMKIEGENGKAITIKPTAWLMDALFRPQLAIKQPTFRIDNSDVLLAINVKTRGKRDRYSYEDIEPGRVKLVELAKTYEAIEKDKRDPVQEQTIALAYNFRNYESLLGYFGFARFGVTLTGSGKDGAPDQRADTREQLVEIVGFEHIVVCTCIEAGHTLLHRVAGGDYQHRGGVLARAQRLEHFHAVAPGQAQVEQHQVVALAAQRGVGHFAVSHPVDREMLCPQQVEHGLADHGVVFDQQQAHRQMSLEKGQIVRRLA